MSKPLIGLNTDHRPATPDASAFSFVCADYADSLTKAGAVPVLLHPTENEADLCQVLDLLDGIVMTGGLDLDPRRDSWMLHPSNRLMDPRREQFDRVLIRMVADIRLPVLAIGAGMQLLNVSEGGTLFLHIPEDVPRALPHVDPLDREHRHAIRVAPGSLMERVYVTPACSREICVKSSHHMAVDDVAPGFAVTARCPDGIVEAIESVQMDWFATGTQFHPEGGVGAALDFGVFVEFVERAQLSTPEQRGKLR